MTTRVLTITIFITLFSSIATVAYGQVMQSGSFRLGNDSINVGGLRGTSTSFTLESSVGEVGSGPATSTSFRLKAGYQQMQETSLSLNGGGNVTMSPAISGLTGGTSNGSTTFTVITDNPAGYSLSITASNSPAMRSGANTIPDYSPDGAAPDFDFTTLAGEAHFGFSPEGSDIVTRFKGDGGSTCNTDTTDTTLSCWDGLDTLAQVIARRTSSNHPSGSDTTIRFRVGVGSAVNQTAGAYSATTTVTLLAL